MTSTLKRSTTAMALAAVAAFGTGAGAAEINIENVTGVWSGATPADTVGLDGLGTSQIRWGTPTSADGDRSGYLFEGRAPQSDVTSPFVAGTFTHFNNPIQGFPTPPSIDGATLDVTVEGNVDDSDSFTLTSRFVLSHDETENIGSQCPDDVIPCDDIVTRDSASYGSDTLTVDGQQFVFDISGFEDGLSFSSPENGTNSANLLGEFITRPDMTPVPLPAAGWMLVAGVGGLAAVGRLRRKA